MIKKMFYGSFILCIVLFMTFWVIKLMGDQKPSSGTEEYLKLHGYVEGQVNEIRVGGVLLRFPAGVKFSPHSSGRIIKGLADMVTTRLIYSDNEKKSNVDGVRIDINKYGEEDPMILDLQHKKEQWKSIVDRSDLGLIEYHRMIPGGWGGVTYVAKLNDDRTPRGSLIRFLCSDVNNVVVECRSDFVTKNNIAISYFFAGENLKDWKLINREVIKFVNSIIVEE